MAAGYGQLITSIFGAGSALHGTGSSNTTGKVNTTGVKNSTGTTNTRGNTVNKGVTVNKNVSGTDTKGNTGTLQTTKSGGTTTTVGTADQGAINTAKGIASTALRDSTDQSKVSGLIDSTLGKAAIAFAPTLAAGTSGSGLYNSSTVDLLSGYAKGQAVADAAGQVLNYQQGEQQIAAGANASVLEATKGSTANTNNVTTGASNTTNQQSSDTTSLDVQKVTDLIKQFQGVKSSTQDKTSNTTNSEVDNKSKNDSSGDSGGIFSSLSLVCAEMLRQDKMELRLWVMINRHFIDTVGPNGKEGYWAWAGPVAYFARRNPKHWFTEAMFWLTEERACYVAAKYLGKTPKYKITWKGWLAYKTIFYFSYAIAGLTYIPRNLHHYRNGTVMGNSSKDMFGVKGGVR